MPQSHARILVHLTFSTRDRIACLSPAIRAELHPYLATVLDHSGCPPMQCGGAADHVHLFFGLSRTLSISEIVEAAKTSSSKWIKTKRPALQNFHWQAGYGAFSVGQSNAARVVQYIQNQEEHHKAISYQDELRRFFERYKVAYDERYVWD